MREGIYDKPRYIDRYTLVTKDGLMYGFNDAPYHPQGFGQFVGTWTGGSRSHLGKRIDISDLSEEAQKFVSERL